MIAQSTDSEPGPTGWIKHSLHAYSDDEHDDGQTWITNWHMDLTRRT
ncbi:hypothetical protein ACWEIK_17755 [Streptomyces sp. NPDC004673]